MKTLKSSLLLILCLTLSSYHAASGFSNEPLKHESAARANSATLESLVPREGLRFYFEARSLAQLTSSPSALEQVARLLHSSGKHITTSEMASFLTRNHTALSSARLAIVSYGPGGTASLLEAASPVDAERLKPELAHLVGSQTQSSPDLQIDISARGRIVLAGFRSTITRLTEADYSLTLVEDQTFLRARSRFSSEPFFIYMQAGGLPVPAMGNSGVNPAYAAMFNSLSSIPQSVGMGGTITGDQIALRALMFSSKDQKDMFSAIVSPLRAGQMAGAAFASPDTDMLVDVMIDWDRLYDSVESLFDMFISATAGSDGTAPTTYRPSRNPDEYIYKTQDARKLGLLSPTEASLGFSIKNDLLPTLGSELAVTISGLSNLFPAHATRPSRPVPPRFLLLISLRNPAGFEKLLGQILNPRGRAARPFAQLAYRGAMIRYRKDMAYAITGGYFIAGGSLDAIKRALDARYLGASLASSAQFREVMGGPRPSMMQMFISSAMAGLYSQMSQAALRGVPAAPAQSKQPFGFVMTADHDGMMIDMRAPVSMTIAGLSMSATGYGMTSSPSGTGGRKPPRLTTDDIRRP
ncbi:MAG: hypothetical protein AB1631_05220 [Acidobacteriota bacterium]